MLSQEAIYQNLQAGNYSKIIMILHENRREIKHDPSINHAIDIFLAQMFQQIEYHGVDEEIKNSLDLLFVIVHGEFYSFKDEYTLKLIHLLWKGEHADLWQKIALKFPSDPVCVEIIEIYKLQQVKIESTLYTKETKPNRING